MKQHYTLRVLSMLLALVLMFELIPTGVLAVENTEGDPEETTVQEVPEGEACETVVGEVEQYREESVKHFRMEDGSFIAVDYGSPVHYSLDEGEDKIWHDIDNSLILESAGLARAGALGGDELHTVQKYTAVNGTHSKSFAGNLSSGFLF